MHKTGLELINLHLYMFKLTWNMDIYYFVCIHGDMYGIVRLYTYIYIDIFEMNADIKSVKWAVSKIQLSKMHSNNNCKGICTYSSSFGDLDSSEL